jgi:hypothetical protein
VRPNDGFTTIASYCQHFLSTATMESHSPRVGRSGLVSEGEFVAEDIEAGDAIFAFFIVALTLAAHFAAGDFAFGGNGAGQFNAEIEVSANAFPIRAIETENGFGVFEVGFVFHAAIARNAFGVEIFQVDSE